MSSKSLAVLIAMCLVAGSDGGILTAAAQTIARAAAPGSVGSSSVGAALGAQRPVGTALPTLLFAGAEALTPSRVLSAPALTPLAAAPGMALVPVVSALAPTGRGVASVVPKTVVSALAARPLSAAAKEVKGMPAPGATLSSIMPAIESADTPNGAELQGEASKVLFDGAKKRAALEDEGAPVVRSDFSVHAGVRLDARSAQTGQEGANRRPIMAANAAIAQSRQDKGEAGGAATSKQAVRTLISGAFGMLVAFGAHSTPLSAVVVLALIALISLRNVPKGMDSVQISSLLAAFTTGALVSAGIVLAIYGLGGAFYLAAATAAVAGVVVLVRKWKADMSGDSGVSFALAIVGMGLFLVYRALRATLSRTKSAAAPSAAPKSPSRLRELMSAVFDYGINGGSRIGASLAIALVGTGMGGMGVAALYGQLIGFSSVAAEKLALGLAILAAAVIPITMAAMGSYAAARTIYGWLPQAVRDGVASKLRLAGEFVERNSGLIRWGVGAMGLAAVLAFAPAMAVDYLFAAFAFGIIEVMFILGHTPEKIATAIFSFTLAAAALAAVIAPVAFPLVMGGLILFYLLANIFSA